MTINQFKKSHKPKASTQLWPVSTLISVLYDISIGGNYNVKITPRCVGFEFLIFKKRHWNINM